MVAGDHLGLGKILCKLDFGNDVPSSTRTLAAVDRWPKQDDGGWTCAICYSLATAFSTHSGSCAVSESRPKRSRSIAGYGTGPKYRKIGGRVIYALCDLKAWADVGVKTSTSDPVLGRYPRPNLF
jgi:hypothetical protein